MEDISGWKAFQDGRHSGKRDIPVLGKGDISEREIFRIEIFREEWNKENKKI